MTELAIPVWIIVTLFLLIPLAVIAAMTAQRWRDKRAQVRGFEVKPTSGPSPEQREREANHG